jgi:hypothetical protein
LLATLEKTPRTRPALSPSGTVSKPNGSCDHPSCHGTCAACMSSYSVHLQIQIANQAGTMDAPIARSRNRPRGPCPVYGQVITRAEVNRSALAPFPMTWRAAGRGRPSALRRRSKSFLLIKHR